MPKGLSKAELAYIQDNCLTKSDKEIAEHLERDVRTVKTWRKKFGIEKTAGGKIADISKEDALTKAQAEVSNAMTEDQRSSFFKTQLKNSLFYDNLKEQLTKDEIGFYLEEWGALCVQFEDIVGTEKRQIDELIKAEILGNRILRNVKIAEDEIEAMQEEVTLLRESTDMVNDEEARARDEELLALIKLLGAQSDAMSNYYQKNVDLRNKLLNELNARRRDRIDQIERGTTTFTGLVEAFRARELRETQGQHAELLRLARKQKEQEWRKPTRFPDGQKDCILMDEHSVLPEKEVINVTKDESQFLVYFKDTINKRIMVVEDDFNKQQFFIDQFGQNTVEFCTSVRKATERLKKDDNYDLICLDYDIGLGEKSDQIVKYIIDKDKAKNAKYLIHSMNKEGAEKLAKMLYDERDFEVVNFESLLKAMKGENDA